MKKLKKTEKIAFIGKDPGRRKQSATSIHHKIKGKIKNGNKDR